MGIIKYRFVFYIISGIMILTGLVGLILWQLKPGIEFTGGSLLEVVYDQNVRPPVALIESALTKLEVKSTVQPIGEKGILVRAAEIPEAKHQELLTALGEIFKVNQNNPDLKALVEAVIPVEEQTAFWEKSGADVVTENRFEAIGPAIGKELQDRSLMALLLVTLMIGLYVSWAFRKSSGLIKSWQYGAVTLITLFHDVFITIGAFAFLGHFLGTEVNAAFIAAILTVLGYSVNDTVVVFDRIRENLRRLNEKDFAKLVGTSLEQTFVRSFNTSFTVLITLAAIFIFGGASLQMFTGALLIGIGVGTYSSIFIASPMLVDVAKWRNR